MLLPRLEVGELRTEADEVTIERLGPGSPLQECMEDPDVNRPVLRLRSQACQLGSVYRRGLAVCERTACVGYGSGE